MSFLEKFIWALTLLAIAALVLVMVFLKPSPIHTSAIEVKEIKEKPAGTAPDMDFSSSGKTGSRKGSTASGRKGPTSSRPSARTTKTPLKYQSKSKNPKVKDYSVSREFGEKYRGNYREVWQALQNAQAQIVTYPDGTKAARIMSIQPGSIIEKLGFKVGDEVTLRWNPVHARVMKE